MEKQLLKVTIMNLQDLNGLGFLSKKGRLFLEDLMKEMKTIKETNGD